MPNWCANRLRVTGLAENVSQLRALMRGEVRPAYARAEGQGIQLFLAGCAGLLRPVTDEMYAPFPALTAAGQGEDTPENRAFTQWLVQLHDGAELTDETCDRLHDLWLATGLRCRTWDALDDEAQAVMTSLWKRKHFDWSGVTAAALSECWDQVCGDAIADDTAEFDMRLLLPARKRLTCTVFHFRPCFLRWTLSRTWTLPWTETRLTPADPGSPPHSACGLTML